ncbi:hypothetical protein SpCBS45565_g03894 [Spizellomyces sp. 'palustris']|nr:hypothetical protein SpCBS45565_g03894 [Spizellomyces sp. 'palustris']
MRYIFHRRWFHRGSVIVEKGAKLSPSITPHIPPKSLLLLPAILFLVLSLVLSVLHTTGHLGPTQPHCPTTYLPPTTTGPQNCSSYETICDGPGCASILERECGVVYECLDERAKTYAECVKREDAEREKCRVDREYAVGECYKWNKDLKEGRSHGCSSVGVVGVPILAAFTSSATLLGATLGLVLHIRANRRLKTDIYTLAYSKGGRVWEEGRWGFGRVVVEFVDGKVE